VVLLLLPEKGLDSEKTTFFEESSKQGTHSMIIALQMAKSKKKGV